MSINWKQGGTTPKGTEPYTRYHLNDYGFKTQPVENRDKTIVNMKKENYIHQYLNNDGFRINPITHSGTYIHHIKQQQNINSIARIFCFVIGGIILINILKK